MHLAIQALSLASLHATETKKTNISSKRSMVKKSQLAGGGPAGYLQSMTKDLNSALPRNKSR